MKVQVWQKIGLWFAGMCFAIALALPLTTGIATKVNHYVITDPGGGHGGG